MADDPFGLMVVGEARFQQFWPTEARKVHLRRPSEFRSLCRAQPYDHGEEGVFLDSVPWMLCATCGRKAGLTECEVCGSWTGRHVEDECFK